MSLYISGTGFGDLSPSGLHLTNSGTQWGVAGAFPLIPIANFGIGGTDRIYRADEAAFYVSGTESDMISASQGLTIGCWAYNTELGNDDHALMSQWDTSSDRSYLLYQTSTGTTGAYISGDGSAVSSRVETNATVGIATDEWHHYVLQWSPSARDNVLRLWVDGNYWETASVGIASLHNSTANFGIGHSYQSSGTPTRYFEGYISAAFFCGARVYDSTIKALYHRTRPLYQSRQLWV
jgi:hypothetical protein